MKVNNLLKRIGSVVTTAAMLATLGTTGFAADPTPYGGSLKGDKIKITNVTRDAKENGVYEFTINYDSGSAGNQNSIGVTMLAYVMKDRDADVSVGTEDNKTAYNPEKMQIVGVNQETQAAQGGTIKFAVATSKDATKLENAMVMKPGQEGLVMIGGDNTTPAIAKFSIPDAAKPIVAVTVSKVEGKLDGVNVTGSGSEYTIETVPYNTSFSKVKEAINFVIKNGDTTLTKDTDYTVAWDKNDSDMLNLNSTATATVTLNSTADYDFGSDSNTKTYTFNITVGEKPAEVESNKAWELGNTGEYNAGTVKVYLPTTAKKDDVVIATLYKADGTTLAGATATVTLTSDYNADTYNSVDLTFDKSFNAAGINANDKYTVKVTVAGTPLVYKDAENNDADSVQGTVYPTTSRRPSTGGGSTTPEVKSYNVSVKADNNGKATVNKSKATAGETVAVNVEPNEGYKVKEITVKDVNGKSIDVDQKTRTFEMPEGAVTVTVTFEEGTEEPTPDDKGKFKDVPDSFWAAADIYTLREAGIIDGKTADEFDPEGQVTRAEFTKMIVKMFGVEAKDTKVEFADCGEDDWFTPFVAAAVEAGYVKGYSDTEFAPDKVISREEACAILGRAYAKAANSELSFTDKDSIDEYAQPYVALLVEMGFINGYEDGTFRAQNHITRAEAAKIIGCAYRLATASK